jgi:hypothetical protein
VVGVAVVLNSRLPVVAMARVSVPTKPLTAPVSSGMTKPTFWLSVSAT